MARLACPTKVTSWRSPGICSTACMSIKSVLMQRCQRWNNRSTAFLSAVITRETTCFLAIRSRPNLLRLSIGLHPVERGLKMTPPNIFTCQSDTPTPSATSQRLPTTASTIFSYSPARMPWVTSVVWRLFPQSPGNHALITACSRPSKWWIPTATVQRSIPTSSGWWWPRQ